MARVNAEVAAERLNDVREALVTLAPIASVRYQLAKRWSAAEGRMVSLATVDTYIKAVRKEWREEAEILDRESAGSFVVSRRDLLRKALERQAMRATQKKQLRRVLEKRLDDSGKEVEVEVSKMVTVPDEHTFSRAVRELIELDNVRVTPEIRITGAMGTTVTAGPNAYRELLAQLRGERAPAKAPKPVAGPTEPVMADDEDLNDRPESE